MKLEIFKQDLQVYRSNNLIGLSDSLKYDGDIVHTWIGIINEKGDKDKFVGSPGIGLCSELLVHLNSVFKMCGYEIDEIHIKYKKLDTSITGLSSMGGSDRLTVQFDGDIGMWAGVSTDLQKAYVSKINSKYCDEDTIGSICDAVFNYDVECDYTTVDYCGDKENIIVAGNSDYALVLIGRNMYVVNTYNDSALLKHIADYTGKCDAYDFINQCVV